MATGSLSLSPRAAGVVLLLLVATRSVLANREIADMAAAGWDWCGAEQNLETCACQGFVKYGNQNGYTEPVAANGCLDCRNFQFPDSTAGGAKMCFCNGTQIRSGVQYGSCRSWVRVARMHGDGNCTGMVRYGRPDRGYVFRNTSREGEQFRCFHGSDGFFSGLTPPSNGEQVCDCQPFADDWTEWPTAAPIHAPTASPTSPWTDQGIDYARDYPKRQVGNTRYSNAEHPVMLTWPSASPGECLVTVYRDDHCGGDAFASLAIGNHSIAAIPDQARAPVTHILSWGFDVSAASVFVRVGDTVTWNWDQDDNNNHDVVSGSRAEPDGHFASALLGIGASFSHTFPSPGVFNYHCTPHGGMMATITVLSGDGAAAESFVVSGSGCHATVFDNGNNFTADGTVVPAGGEVKGVKTIPDACQPFPSLANSASISVWTGNWYRPGGGASDDGGVCTCPDGSSYNVRVVTGPGCNGILGCKHGVVSNCLEGRNANQSDPWLAGRNMVVTCRPTPTPILEADYDRPCTLGDVKLPVNGLDPYIFAAGRWNPICEHYWQDNRFGAGEVCRKLGYSGGFASLYQIQQYRTRHVVDAWRPGRLQEFSDLLSGEAGGNQRYNDWHCMHARGDLDAMGIKCDGENDGRIASCDESRIEHRRLDPPVPDKAECTDGDVMLESDGTLYGDPIPNPGPGGRTVWQEAGETTNGAGNPFVFINGSWMPICKVGFKGRTNDGAETLCQTLGFETGVAGNWMGGAPNLLPALEIGVCGPGERLDQCSLGDNVYRFTRQCGNQDGRHPVVVTCGGAGSSFVGTAASCRNWADHPVINMTAVLNAPDPDSRPFQCPANTEDHTARFPSAVLTCPTVPTMQTTCGTLRGQDVYARITRAVARMYDSLPTACDEHCCPQGDLAACLLRLAGHDFMDFDVIAGTGGSNGCLDFSDIDNKGLFPCLAGNGEFSMGVTLQSVYEDFCGEVSLADFIVVVAEAMMLKTRPVVTPPPSPAPDPWHFAPHGATICDTGQSATQEECVAASAFVRQGRGDRHGDNLLVCDPSTVSCPGECGRRPWGIVPIGCSVKSGHNFETRWKPSEAVPGGVVNASCVIEYQLVCSGPGSGPGASAPDAEGLSFGVPMFGRQSELACSPRPLPNAEDGCMAVKDNFVDQLGLDWEKSAALMGVHTLGRASPENSGYVGWWNEGPAGREFTNSYFVSLIAKGWEPKQLTPNKNQWIRGDGGSRLEMMLNSDLCLLFETEVKPLLAAEFRRTALAGNDSCCAWAADSALDGIASQCSGGLANANNCCQGGLTCNDEENPTGSPAAEFVKLFARDEEAWLVKFAEAWEQATQNGHGGSLFDPAVCDVPLLAPPTPSPTTDTSSTTVTTDTPDESRDMAAGTADDDVTVSTSVVVGIVVAALLVAIVAGVLVMRQRAHGSGQQVPSGTSSVANLVYEEHIGGGQFSVATDCVGDAHQPSDGHFDVDKVTMAASVSL